MEEQPQEVVVWRKVLTVALPLPPALLAAAIAAATKMIVHRHGIVSCVGHVVLLEIRQRYHHQPPMTLRLTLLHQQVVMTSVRSHQGMIVLVMHRRGMTVVWLRRELI